MYKKISLIKALSKWAWILSTKKMCNTFLFHTIPSEDFWNIVRPSKSLRGRRNGPASKVNIGESVLRRESVLQGH